MSRLADVIARSLRNDPARWSESMLSLRRDDGVELQYGKPFADGTVCTAMLIKPLRVQFGWLDRRRLKAAVRNWVAAAVERPQTTPNPESDQT